MSDDRPGLAVGCLASLGVAGLAAWALQGRLSTPALGAWLALLVLVLAFGLLLRPLAVAAAAQRRRLPLRLWSALHGGVWGALALLLPPPWSADTLVLLAVLVGAVALAGLAMALVDEPAALLFAAAVVLPLALQLPGVERPWPRVVPMILLLVPLLALALLAALRRQRIDHDAELLLRRVFDHVDEGLCMFDGDQQLVAWNARMVELMGVDPGSVRSGVSLRSMLLQMAQRGEFGAVDIEAEVQRRLQLMAGRTPLVERRTRPDGRIIEVRRRPMPDGGFTLVAVDISERQASELALADNRNMLALLLQSTEEGVWTIDNELITVDANPAMCRMLGFERQQLIGRSIYDFVDADNERIFRDQVRRRAEGMASSYEIALRRSDGRLVHCQNNPAPLFDPQGRKVGAIGFFTDITAIKETAAELRRTSELLAAKSRLLEGTLESLSQGVLNVAADGHVEAWNRRVVELLKLPEALLQRHPSLREVVEWQLAQGQLGTDLAPPEAWRQAASLYAAGEGSALWSPSLYQRQLADGTVVEVQLHRGPGGSQVRTYSDVTHRVTAERALAASEARFRTMADAAPALIWQCDAGGRAIWFNQAWLQRLHLDLPQALAQQWHDRIDEADYARCTATFDAAVATRAPFEVEYRLKTADGSAVWVVDRGIPHFDGGGQFDGYLAYGWDITARKAAEQALIAARDEAERANLAKSQFLSRMSHELRTPLNAVLGFAQLMERDPAEPPARRQMERLQHILRGGRHLLVLINDVLDLARIESGALDLQFEPVDVQALVEGCRHLVEPMAREREVRLHLRRPPGAAVVQADATRLRQVLLNLLSNAIKYNRQGGEVVLSYGSGNGSLRIEVSDSGPGLTAAQQERLFQAFERLDADRSAIEGAGIGLALSKSLVDLMHGRIGVRSVPGEGSSFWVELPRLAGAMPSAAGGHGADLPRLPPGGPWRLLYIEDNVVNQLLMESMLAHLPGLELTMADGPEQGLALARAVPPHLVLLDIQLPVLDGYQVLAALRADPATAAIRVVAVSANAMASDLQRARDSGFDHYLSKPLALGELLQVVADQLTLGPRPTTA